MVSDARLELLAEDAEESEEKALRLLSEGNRGLAASYLREAVDRHLEVASKSDFKESEARHLERAKVLRRRVDQLENTGSDADGDGGCEADSGIDTQDGTSGGYSEFEFFGEPPDQDLADVGGLEELKQRLRRDVQLPLEKPEFFEKQGSGIENGVLFYGPPGTGKSWLARCFAGELGWSYAEVHASDVVSKYVGESAKNINRLFEEAEQAAPSVLFIDEIDALASERGGGMGETRSQRQAVNELLQWMQEVQGSDVLVIAATNKPGALDQAITRSQRFNQEFRIGPPDAKARKQILGVQLDEEGRSVDWQSIDWPQLVEWTQGFSAADLTDVVGKAARLSATESTEKGSLVPVQYRHLLKAVKEVEPSFDETQ